MNIVLNVLLSVVSVVIALIAIYQTQKQIKLSNKQQLFDRRLEKYMVIKDLLTLFSNNKKFVVENKSLIKDVALQFNWLTNVTYLTDMIIAVSDALDTKKQNILLSKCEMLEKYAVEISVLWKDETGEVFSRFVRTYKEMLFKMYQQQKSINTYRELNEKQNGIIELMIIGEELEEELMNTAKELALFETIQDLECLYNKIVDENLEQRLIKSLEL